MPGHHAIAGCLGRPRRNRPCHAVAKSGQRGLGCGQQVHEGVAVLSDGSERVAKRAPEGQNHIAKANKEADNTKAAHLAGRPGTHHTLGDQRRPRLARRLHPAQLWRCMSELGSEYVCMCAYIYTYVCVFMCVCVCVCVCIHGCVHVHTHRCEVAVHGFERNLAGPERRVAMPCRRSRENGHEKGVAARQGRKLQITDFILNRKTRQAAQRHADLQGWH